MREQIWENRKIVKLYTNEASAEGIRKVSDMITDAIVENGFGYEFSRNESKSFEMWNIWENKNPNLDNLLKDLAKIKESPVIREKSAYIPTDQAVYHIYIYDYADTIF